MVSKTAYMDTIFGLRKQIEEKFLLDKQKDGTYFAFFSDCLIKERHDSDILIPIFGFGQTEEEACEDYFHAIEGKMLIFRPSHPTERKELFFDVEFEKYKQAKKKVDR